MSPEHPRPYVICVDDEQAVLNQLSAQLTRRFGAAYVVECTESAEEALGLMAEITGEGGEVHLVICDQVMPGMKGDRFLEKVDGTWPGIMKILLTGQAGLDSAIYAINHAGLHRYIEKPWETEDLNLSVESLLTQYRLRQQLAAEHERLERRSRELQRLNEVGLELAEALQSEGVLGLVAGAARALAGAARADVVAQIGSRDRPWWSAPAAPPLSIESRRAFERDLARRRAEGTTGPPAEVPAGFRTVSVVHGGVLFGWLFLEGGDVSREADGLLSILAGQAATTLRNLQLLDERLESERLSTVGRMISTIVHDFRNPMTAVRGYAAMIEDGTVDAVHGRECARLIVDETDRLSGMIDEILEFTRGEPARLRRRPVPLRDLVQRLQKLVEPDLRTRGLRLEVRIDRESEVPVDDDRILRALLNVAGNGLDAMEPGGTLRVRLRGDERQAEIEISDTGRGIPPELQPRIYEPFFTHGKPRGIGLGMSITRKIVEEHGGRIRLESEVGQGTTVTITLPLAPAADTAAAPEGTSPPPA